MPCYRCGTRQVDPEPGQPTMWQRGIVREHQVLICPGCYPEALTELTRCSRCGSVRLVRKLDQVECLECRLTREGDSQPPALPSAPPSGGADSGLADEVAQALARILGK
jgi:ribosomal protein L40E